MLVLSRQPGEKVVIDGGITVTVVSVIAKKVRLAFDAPAQVRILRGELACWQEGPAACDGPADRACPCGEEEVGPPPS
jgi:carbon storage regulator CsrA